MEVSIFNLFTIWVSLRDDGGALVGFQDIHSLAFLRGRPELASCQQVPTVSALNPCPRSIQVGDFEVAKGGGIWVAIRDGLETVLQIRTELHKNQGFLVGIFSKPK